MNGLHLRPIVSRDSGLLYRWRNDPETQRNSLSSSAIPPEQHERWLAAKLSTSSTQLAIAELDGKPVGTVRLDWNEERDACDLSFTVAPEDRGHGIGRAIIEKLLEEIKDARIVAEVKFSNVPSRAIFERLGFQLIDAQGEFLLYAKDQERAA